MVNRVTKAPPPLTALGGSTWTHQPPKPNQPLTDLPAYYPNNLKVRTLYVIGSAIKASPSQRQVMDLCKRVLSKLTPDFCAEVQAARLRSDLAPLTMKHLLHALLVTNCDDSPEQWRLEQELERSNEWDSFIRKLKKAEGRSKKEVETSASTDADIWGQIDHKLASLKIAGMASEHHEWDERKQKEIHFKNRNNQNAATVPSELLGLKIEGIDKWAGSLFHIYAEVWKAQGMEKTPDFVRTVFQKAIVPAIEAKAASSADFLSNRALRTRMPQSILAPHLGELGRAAERLKAEWRRKTEIEAMELEHEQTRREATPKSNVPGRNWFMSPPDVVKRRQIVLKNPSMPARRLCKVFDTERISFPEKWETKFNVTTWEKAYENKDARALIQKMVSTDKNKK